MAKKGAATKALSEEQKAAIESERKRREEEQERKLEAERQAQEEAFQEKVRQLAAAGWPIAPASAKTPTTQEDNPVILGEDGLPEPLWRRMQRRRLAKQKAWVTERAPKRRAL